MLAQDKRSAANVDVFYIPVIESAGCLNIMNIIHAVRGSNYAHGITRNLVFMGPIYTICIDDASYQWKTRTDEFEKKYFTFVNIKYNFTIHEFLILFGIQYKRINWLFVYFECIGIQDHIHCANYKEESGLG